MKKAIAITIVAACAAVVYGQPLTPSSIDDWSGAMNDLTCEDSVFDTHGGMTVLISRGAVDVEPGAVYRLHGDFRLNPYATFANIYFGLVCYDAEGREIGRRYIGESPFNSREHISNRQLVRRYWLTFSGTIPSVNHKWPEGCRSARIIVHFHENHLVDMKFMNIGLERLATVEGAVEK